MIKKRDLRFSAILAAIFLKIIPTVNAYGFNFYDISRGPYDLIEIVKQFFSPFFEVILNTGSYEEFFFTKILLLMILVIVIKFSLEKSEFFGKDKNKGVVLIISLAISIIAIRFIPETDIINLILLPYNAVGIAILTLLPFIIFFFFLHKSNMGSAGRRLSWSLYAVIFGVLWANRSNLLSPIGNQIYGWMLIVILIALFFDKQIHSYFGEAEFKDARNIMIDRKINHLTAHLNYLRTNAPTPVPPLYQKEIDSTEKEIKNLQKSKS